jgi:hypothetical protein
MTFKIDIKDYESDAEIIKSVKTILKLTRNQEFSNSLKNEKNPFLIEQNGFTIIIYN